MNNSQTSKKMNHSVSEFLLFKLAWSDLKHEWILTLCIISAITSVLTPLLLLFGLKHGIIAWGRDYLIQDPGYREIRPLTSKNFNNQWFEQIEQRQDVDFVIPMTRQISAMVKATIKGKDKTARLSIVPTDNADPLLIDNKTKIPLINECVLSKLAADDLNASPGDIMIARVSRYENHQIKYDKMTLNVSGILPLRASGLKSMYVRLPILNYVEKYKDGLAVPEMGWEGSLPKAYAQYNGLVIILYDKLSPVESLELCINTGFTQIKELDNRLFFERTGYHINQNMLSYLLFTEKKPVSDQHIMTIRQKLVNKKPLLIPWIKPAKAFVVNSKGEDIHSFMLYGVPMNKDLIQRMGAKGLPFWETKDHNIMQIILSSDICKNENKTKIRFPGLNKQLVFPVSISNERIQTGNSAFIPIKLAGILNLNHYRHIEYQPPQFVLSRKGYAGFRMYAKTIYDVSTIRHYFESENIPIHHELRAIKKVLDLDKGLSIIFVLLASISLTGTFASLSSNLYASVQRKKREISVLRLIGLSGKKLFRFPIYQAMIIGFFCVSLSLLLFQIFSLFINDWFRPYLSKILDFPINPGINYCKMPFEHYLFIIISVILISCLSALISSLRVIHFEVADALRDE